MKRINKYLAESGYCSRRQADQIISDNRVTINGKLAVLGDQVSESDIICVDQQAIKSGSNDPIILLAFNKPRGVEVTGDPDTDNNVMQALNYKGKERMLYIGRLDVASEGLLLFTNKGDLVNKILRSKNNNEKEYIVVFDKPISPSKIKQMRIGVDIGDTDRGPTLPAKVQSLGAKRIRIVLTEGRHRQIRRMAESLSLNVVRLKRIRVMNILLGELKSGSYKKIDSKDLETFLSQLQDAES